MATVFAEAAKAVKRAKFEIANRPVECKCSEEMAQWFYSKSGTQLGPVSEGELRSKIGAGEVSAADLIWKEGMSDWQAAGKIVEFANSSSVQLRAEDGVQSPYVAPSVVTEPLRQGADIPNYLWQSIVVCFFCCLPLGIVAIVFAAKVNTLRLAGDIPGAMAASASAKKWCVIAAIVGFVTSGIIFAISFATGVSGQLPN